MNILKVQSSVFLWIARKNFFKAGRVKAIKISIMEKTVIYTENAPEPVGPYSQALLVNNMLFVSGQIAINPLDGSLNTGNIRDETRQVMKNIEGVLAAANMTFFNVVKCSIFIRNMDDFTAVNKVYGAFFTKNPPARETIEVSRLPKNANVEISCIAALL